MKYVIHQRAFAYNDEFYDFKQGRKIHSIYSDKGDAFSQWIALERHSLNDIPLSYREPMQLYYTDAGKYDQQSIQNWQYVFDKLNDYGIKVGFSENSTLPDDKSLQLDKLTDEQLAELLLHTGCYEYILQGFTESDKKYVLYFVENGLSDFYSGYLVADEEVFLQGILEKDSPEELFEMGTFGYISEFEPIASFYSQTDAQNPLVQSILQQYPNSFKIVGDMIGFYDEEDYQPLQAMNAVLEQPFYEIRAYTPEELLVLQQSQQQEDDMPISAHKSLENYQQVISQETQAIENFIQPKNSFWDSLKNWLK